MRIGLVIYGVLETLSGGYLYDTRLVEFLKQQGDEVIVYSLPAGSDWHAYRQQPGNELVQQVLAAQPDVLIEDEWVHPAVFGLNRHLKRAANFPIVSLVHLLTSFDHHPLYNGWLIRHYERKHLRSVDGLIFNSQTTRQQVRSLLSSAVPPHTVAVPAGDNFPDIQIRPHHIPELMTAPGPLKILFVGNVIQRKGLHVLIRALKRLPPEQFQVTVAGRLDMEPKYVAQVRRLVARWRLEEQVRFTGPLQPDALAALYQDHHVMALPSTYEGYGIAYVEAQQFGMPVIGTSGGAAREIITHGENGYLIRPGAHQTLAYWLKSLNSDRNLLLTLSRNARGFYREHPTWRDTGKKIRTFLETLA